MIRRLCLRITCPGSLTLWACHALDEFPGRVGILRARWNGKEKPPLQFAGAAL